MKTIKYITTVLLVLFFVNAVAQMKKELNVAVLIYDHVEILDFGGPSEVFAASPDFNVYTVTADSSRRTIESQGFIDVTPDYTIYDCPAPDIVILPGGGTSNALRHEGLIPWVKGLYKNDVKLLSVCTGVRILAEANLLDGQEVTTWYGAIERYAEQYPEITFLKDTRFVDNGNIITTAGVSAGIDGSLHLVSRIRGLDVAYGTAKYMEYDKWDPDAGLINYKNPDLEKISLSEEKPVINIDKLRIYEGELKALAAHYYKDKQLSQAARVMELAVKLYPESITSFDLLGRYYRENDQYAPPSSDEYVAIIRNDEIDKAVDIYTGTKAKYPNWMLFRESTMNWLGYQQLNKNNTANAIMLFELNTQQFPRSANAFDSLAEAYLKAGDTTKAQKYYKKALQLDPELASAQAALKDLK